MAEGKAMVRRQNDHSFCILGLIFVSLCKTRGVGGFIISGNSHYICVLCNIFASQVELLTYHSRKK